MPAAPPSTPAPGGDRKHWLAGLAKCAACGGGLVFAKPHYLKCGRYGKGKCPCSQHVPAEELERAVLDRLRADCTWAGAFAVLPAASEEQKTRQALARELAALERREQRLREAYLCGAEALPEYRRAKGALQDQQAALRQRQAALDQTDPGQAQARWDTVLATLEDPLADTQAKHRAAQSILADCRWGPGQPDGVPDLPPEAVRAAFFSGKTVAFFPSGGPDGELGASLRYLSQRYAMPYPAVQALLTDIGTEELGHLEMIAAIVHQLTRNLTDDQIQNNPAFAAYFVDHTGGIYPTAASGFPWTAASIGVKGDPICDLTEDLAADGTTL